ncbi:MAG TPA: cation diffusion facilitator family transporter [Candidatus Solibacter sp.]|nr:cation diffusion facilitator family transporter [Candidatus Solibacter sp.]
MHIAKIASSLEEDMRFGRRVAIASIAASCVLATANIAVGRMAGSTTVVAAGVEFVGDVIASTFVLLGMIFGSRPADENHPYGHGRVEILAGLTVGIILAAGGVGICYRSLGRISEIHPPPGVYAMWPLIGAIVLRSAMSAFKFRGARRIGSASLIADARNDAVDIVSSVTALAALGLTLFDPGRFLAADHYGGVAVGLFVIYTGLRILRDTSMDLIDTMPHAGTIEAIRRAAAAVEGVRGTEKCYARKTGLKYHVELHVDVDPWMTVEDSHAVATQVRSHIRSALPAVGDVVVHIEPHRPV